MEDGPMSVRDLLRELLASENVDLDAQITAEGREVLGFTTENNPFGLNYVHLKLEPS